MAPSSAAALLEGLEEPGELLAVSSGSSASATRWASSARSASGSARSRAFCRACAEEALEVAPLVDAADGVLVGQVVNDEPLLVAALRLDPLDRRDRERGLVNPGGEEPGAARARSRASTCRRVVPATATRYVCGRGGPPPRRACPSRRRRSEARAQPRVALARGLEPLVRHGERLVGALQGGARRGVLGLRRARAGGVRLHGRRHRAGAPSRHAASARAASAAVGRSAGRGERHRARRSFRAPTSSASPSSWSAATKCVRRALERWIAAAVASPSSVPGARPVRSS